MSPLASKGLKNDVKSGEVCQVQIPVNFSVLVITCHCKGTAHTSPGPVVALRFHPAFWDDAGQCRCFSPKRFWNWLLHFREPLALSGELPCYGGAAGISCPWLSQYLRGQVYCSEFFTLALAREIVAHIAGSVRQAPPFSCKILHPFLLSLLFFPSPPAKSTFYGSRAGSVISSTELYKAERRLKALKTYGLLWLNRK